MVCSRALGFGSHREGVRSIKCGLEVACSNGSGTRPVADHDFLV